MVASLCENDLNKNVSSVLPVKVLYLMHRPDPSVSKKASIKVVTSMWKWGRFCHGDMVSKKPPEVRNKKEKVERHDKLPLTLYEGLTLEGITGWGIVHLDTRFPYPIGCLCRNKNLEATPRISAPKTLMERTFDQPMLESLYTLENWLTHLTFSYSKNVLSSIIYILWVQTNVVLPLQSVC